MSEDAVFGSGDLSPELLRGVAFDEQDGRIDASSVRTFLDRVASAVEVAQSTDAQEALRREFARNAEIAQQVLDAGQAAAEQLRSQANEAAGQIVASAEAQATAARGELEGELVRSRTQVAEMRTALIADLRDLYDRIGASLYRFERAVQDEDAAPISVPQSATQAAQAAPAAEAPTPVAAPPIAVEPSAPQADAHSYNADELSAEEEAGSDLPPPAWTQLPSQAWGEPDGSAASSGVDAPAGSSSSLHGSEPATAHASEPGAAFNVVEDDPLAPGEPLVDLRNFHDAASETSLDNSELADAGSSYLDPHVAQPAPVAPDAVDAAAGSWLDPGQTPLASTSPDVVHDDALAEALISGDVFPNSEPVAEAAPAAPEAPEAVETPEPAPVDLPAAEPVSPPPTHAVADMPAPVPGTGANAAAPSPAAPAAPGASGGDIDAAEVAKLILDSLAAGQSRESIENYLRDQMGLLQPGVLIDAALGSNA
ncbi:MAG: hypothetical protein JWM90_1278 [Thermoleophilia bacterium]|nr:hypothetical protein [Thermoleophilia bacterium]